MTQSRWKFPTFEVTVGENTQKVRKLTAGERREFMLASKKISQGEMEAPDLPFLVVSLGAVDPSMTREDAKDMPPDLLDACCRRIMELIGMKPDEAEIPTAAADTGEKKDPTAS